MPKLTCSRRVTKGRCGKIATFRMRIMVAGFETFLYACTACRERSPERLGGWDPIG